MFGYSIAPTIYLRAAFVRSLAASVIVGSERIYD